MAWVFNAFMYKFVAKVLWRGKCGATLLRLPAGAAGAYNLIYAVGIHGAHGELSVDSFLDLAWLLARRPFGSRVIIVGDWNVDLLPVLPEDPWCARPMRKSHHAGQRSQLQAFTAVRRLQTIVPKPDGSSLGGPFKAECVSSPITRIPVGESSQAVLPSTLDFAVAAEGTISDACLHWLNLSGDHALTVYTLCSHNVKTRTPSRFGHVVTKLAVQRDSRSMGQLLRVVLMLLALPTFSSSARPHVGSRLMLRSADV